MLLGIASVALTLAAWEGAARLGWTNPFFTSSPGAIAARLAQQMRSGELQQNAGVSVAEFAAGYGAAVVAGVTGGVLAARFPVIEYVLDPFLWFLYSAPLIAFYPLFVIWFGLGTRMVIAVTFLLSVTQITLSTLSGIRNVDAGLLRAARSFGATERDLLWKVTIPASVPAVVAGLRLAIGRALTGVIVTELFGATAGLGFSIAYYGGLLKTTEMLSSLVVIVVLGVLSTQALSAAEAYFDSWRTGPGL
jgi:ABC-type nitrate/sulfonate/bicarbonate transport system permease component